MLLLVPYLVECGYFKEVEFIFLIVGHTKNTCDRLFNSLKSIYRLKNIWHFPQLLEVLNHSHTITIHPTTSSDFYNWRKHLVMYYSELKGKIEQNHIFHCNSIDMLVNAAGDKIIPFKIKEANIEDAKTSDIKNICKKKRSQELPNGTHPEPLSPIHENPYKVVEFYNKWKKVIREQFRAVACPEPTPEQYAAVKLEAGMRSGVKKLRGTGRLANCRRWRMRYWKI